jgi:hypothetical protein
MRAVGGAPGRGRLSKRDGSGAGTQPRQHRPTTNRPRWANVKATAAICPASRDVASLEGPSPKNPRHVAAGLRARGPNGEKARCANRAMQLPRGELAAGREQE